MPDFEKLIVGLGNPGSEYEHTAHNLGFMVVDRLAARHGIRVSRKECMALVGHGSIPPCRVVLAEPQTFMNLSGSSVQGLLVKYEIAAAAGLILIYDDLDLPWLSLRIRREGSAGGHNGVRSVIAAMGTQEFVRVRLGIDGGSGNRDGARIVLAKLSRARNKELDELLDYASQAVESIIADGAEKAMTRFNRRAGGLPEEEQ